MSVVIAFVAGLLACRLFVTMGHGLLRAPALERRNHRNRLVPTGAGVIAVLAVLAIEAGRVGFFALGVGDAPDANVDRLLVVIACLGFGLLGFVDDIAGTVDDRGFRGHLRALVAGRVTTGVLKLVGGGALALVLVGGQAHGASGVRVVSDAVLVALAANLANLFDAAPGRVLKAALVAWIPIAIVAGADAVGVALAPAVGAFAGLFGDDLRERVMLGDAGAYALGGALGLGVVLECAPSTRSVVLAVLGALTIAGELTSFSRVIDRVPPLRALDHLGRKRT